MMIRRRAILTSAAAGTIAGPRAYWDLNDRTRIFLTRLKSRTPNNYPNSEHACAYGAVTHYMRATTALGIEPPKASGLDVVAAIKGMPTDDDCFSKSSIRADGRVLHLTYLPSQSVPERTGPWDLYKVLGKIESEQVFRPLGGRLQ